MIVLRVEETMTDAAVYAQDYAWIGLIIMVVVAGVFAYKYRKVLKEKAELIKDNVNNLEK